MVVLGCDIGGTFTDCVLVDPATGRFALRKVPTTPHDPSEGALRGLVGLLESEGVPPGAVTRIVHGTTVGTNALLTRRVPPVALVTNAGFEDVIEIARQDRPRLYDLRADRPAPLVGRESRFGVRGRLGPRGEEIEPLAEADVLGQLPALARHRAAAVVLLHAYANPAHEERVAALLAKHAPDLAVATSSGTSPEFREYERASTTVANAALLPVMDGYLASLDAGLRRAGLAANLSILDSAGGVVSPATARRKPVLTVLSGPAGGAAAIGWLARLVGERRLLGLDMGGTSTDLSVVVDGEVRETVEGSVGGVPLRVPMLDVATLGAGGGSIVRVDAAGLLKVGPESAEAVPGPACYGRGGTLPTLTDAHVVLGHLETLLGGEFRLDRAAAERALAPVAERLGAGLEETASAAIDVARANLLAACRLATTARGEDPRDFTLCAFGGMGPLHAVALARGLGIRRVLVPVASGVLSAFGMLACDLRRDAVRTWLRDDAEGARHVLRELGKAAASDLAGEAPAGTAIHVRYAFDGRYRGQSHELTLPLGDEDEILDAAEAFDEAHRHAFGYEDPRGDLEVVNLRATAVGRVAAPPPPLAPEGAVRPDRAARRGNRRAVLLGEASEPDVWDRRGLRSPNELEGPAIVEDPATTILLPRGCRARVDRWGNLVVEVRP